MKDLKVIKSTKGINILEETKEGIMGTYTTYDLSSPLKYGVSYTFVFSWNNGWEHLSVSTPKRTPSWDEMCVFKDLFFKEDETCVEYHPKKEDYVNLHEHCLHIWKPLEAELPIPNKALVY